VSQIDELHAETQSPGSSLAITLNVRFLFGIGNRYSSLTLLDHSTKATGAAFFPAVSLEGARPRLLLLVGAETVATILSPLNHVGA
jgi:hypothetical protein